MGVKSTLISMAQKCNDYKTAKERAEQGGTSGTSGGIGEPPATAFCRLASVPIQNFIFFLFLKNYIG